MKKVAELSDEEIFNLKLPSFYSGKSLSHLSGLSSKLMAAEIRVKAESNIYYFKCH